MCFVKKLLLIVLAAHIVLEGLVGLALVFSPQTLVPDASQDLLSGLIVQGFCALSTVILALWLIPYRGQRAALTIGLGTLASFHSLLIVSLLLTSPGADQLAGYSHHLILALSFWALWMRRDTLVQA